MEQCQTRSPLTEKLDTKYSLPRSPLAYSSGNYKSSHVLPPLKFHSGLLKPLNTVALSVHSDDDESDYYNDSHNYESESVGSAPDEMCGNQSDDDVVDRPVIGVLEENMLNLNSSKKMSDRKYGSTINRGMLKEDLRIEVPGGVKGFRDVGWGSRGCGVSSAVSGGSCRLPGKKEPHSAYVSIALLSLRNELYTVESLNRVVLRIN